MQWTQKGEPVHRDRVSANRRRPIKRLSEPKCRRCVFESVHKVHQQRNLKPPMSNGGLPRRIMARCRSTTVRALLAPASALPSNAPGRWWASRRRLQGSGVRACMQAETKAPACPRDLRLGPRTHVMPYPIGRRRRRPRIRIASCEGRNGVTVPIHWV
jgi:hypothetical protein